MAVHNKFWDTLQAFGSDESDKMATKRPINRQKERQRQHKRNQRGRNFPQVKNYMKIKELPFYWQKPLIQWMVTGN